MTVTKREMKAILKRFKSTDVNNILQKAGVKIFKDLRRVSRNKTCKLHYGLQLCYVSNKLSCIFLKPFKENGCH